jgi:hypothetical protein
VNEGISYMGTGSGNATPGTGSGNATPGTGPGFTTETVHHPAHYGGGDDPYEAIKVIEAWGLGFHLGNTVKYISRAGRKDPGKLLEDLRKARWYLDRYITTLEGAPHD